MILVRGLQTRWNHLVYWTSGREVVNKHQEGQRAQPGTLRTLVLIQLRQTIGKIDRLQILLSTEIDCIVVALVRAKI